MGILYGVLVVCYVAWNLVVARLMSARTMKEHFIDGQCLVGKVCANIFYAPAWVLKGIRAVVVSCVK